MKAVRIAYAVADVVLRYMQRMAGTLSIDREPHEICEERSHG